MENPIQDNRFSRSMLVALCLAASASSLAAQDLTVPLTPQDVACNARQLGALLERMRIVGTNQGATLVPSTLRVSYANVFGYFEGLATTNQTLRSTSCPGAPPGACEPPERLLAFQINPDVRTFLLNPGRPELEQAAMAREESGSNFVGTESEFAMILRLNPTLGTGGSGDLVVNNLLVPPVNSPYNGFRSSDVKPGRGLTLAGLTQPCHGKLTEQDRRVFNVLQRTVRVQPVGSAPGVGEHYLDSEIAFFRGQEPDVYRADIYPLSLSGERQGRIALSLRVAWTAEGRLTNGEARVLPACAGGAVDGCTDADVEAEVIVAPPVLGGSERWDALGVAPVRIEYAPGTIPPPVAIDWGALLARSTWNQGS